MPTFVIRGPDGKTYEVKAPAGATKDDAVAFVRRQVDPQFAATVRAGEEAIAAGPKLTAGRAAGLVARGATPVAAGAAAGGALGLWGGPAAPVTVPAGVIIGGAVVPLVDVATKVAQTVSGKTWEMPSAVLGRAMTSFGYPAPANTMERMIEAGGAALGGAGTSIPAAARLAATAASPVTRGVMQQLAARPDAQMIAQPVGAMAGEFAMEKTGSPIAGLAVGTAAGAAATPLTASLVRRAVTPFPSRLSGDQRRLVDLARNTYDIPMTTAQLTGSRTLRNTEAVLATMPFAADMTMGAADAQRAAFNRAVLGVAGVNADRATPAVVDQALRDWGQEANGILAQTSALLPDKQFMRELNDSLGRYGMRLERNVSGIYRGFYDDLRAIVRSGHSIPAEVYQNTRSDIGDSIRATRDPQLRNSLQALQRAMDGMVERQAPAGVADDWTDLRRRYSALMVIDDAMGGGTQADRSAGNLPLSAFRSAVDRSDPRGFARGRGQYNDLARIADYLGSTAVPNSGTAQRLLVQGLLGGGGLTGAVMSGHPLGTAAAVAAGVSVPPIVQAAMQSRPGAAYLGNQALPGPAARWTNRRLQDAIAGAFGAERGLLDAP